MGIQSFGTWSPYAKSIKDFENDREHWNRLFNEMKPPGFKGGKIIGIIPKGTIFKIHKLEEQEYGAWGNFWKIQIKLLSGEYENKILQLPDLIQLPGPTWLNDKKFVDGPELNQSFSGACNK